MKNLKILIAGGDQVLHQHLDSKLKPETFDLIRSPGIENILTSLQNEKVDIVIACSSQRVAEKALQNAREIRRHNAKVPIILITRYSSEEMAIAALRAGVNDYFKIPYSGNALLASIQRHLSKSPHPAEAFPYSTPAETTCLDEQMIGTSHIMQEIKRYLLKVALTDSTVLITGETGTGKDLAAELIHFKSNRHQKPMICVNCASLPENLVESELFGYDRGAFTGAVTAKPGKFASAEGGSVFLDEIGDISGLAQAKILRSIENKEIYPLGGNRAVPLDIRVISATNHEPEKLMAEGKFRKDLYYRLNVARVHLPPLRERKEDLSLLISHGIEKMNRCFKRNVRGLTDKAMDTLFRYDWPGNVRELINLIEASFINLPPRHVDFIDLPKQFQQCLISLKRDSKDERKQIVSALLETKWNKSKAARKLHWSRMTVYRKMAQYHIVPNRNRPE